MSYLRFLALILAITCMNSYAQRRGVIYGEDDRVDPYTVTDQRLLDLTKSTVGLVQRTSLTARSSFSSGTPDPSRNNGFTLKTSHYGQSMGLCKSERFFDQPTGAFCSGSLIAPNLILTAGHCIRNQTACNSTSFVFGFSMKSEKEANTTFKAEDVVHCKKIISREEEGTGADYAVIEIDRPVTHIQPLKMADNSQLKVGTPLIVIGHPSGLPVKLSGGSAVRNMMGDRGYFTANLDTYGGNSGSAVFNFETGEIEGVLVRGENDFVREGNCRISYVCTDSGCRGEDVTKTSYIKQKIQGLTRVANSTSRTRPTTNGGFQNRRSGN